MLADVVRGLSCGPRKSQLGTTMHILARLFAATSLTLASLAHAAPAPAPAPKPPSQEQRIEQGVKDGSLTAKEARQIGRAHV